MNTSVRNKAWVGLLVVMIAVICVGLPRADSGPVSDSDRALAIKSTTLCPVCDGQTVVESNAPIAASIRAFIDERVAAGDTDEQVRQAIEASFPGQGLSAIPPSEGVGALVWVLPVLALAVGATVLTLAFRRWAATSSHRSTEADRDLVAQVRAKR